MCGLPKHTSTSEPYYSDVAYDFTNNSLNYYFKNEKIMIDDSGKTVNILPLVDKNVKKSKTWVCNDYCKVIDVKILLELKSLFCEILDLGFHSTQKYLKKFDICSAIYQNENKLGHPRIRYDQPLLCESKFLKLKILSYHYPNLRTIERIIYKLNYLFLTIDKIDNALENGDFNELKNLIEIGKKFGVFLNNNNTENLKKVNLNESVLKKKYKVGIKDYTKIVTDPPSIPCISCERLFCLRDLESFDIDNNNNAFELLDTKMKY